MLPEHPPALADLRARIARMERPAPGGIARECLPFGAPEIDAALPWSGLPHDAVHEFMSPDPADGAATALIVFLAGRLAAAQGGPVLWVSCRGDLFPPGLAQFGWPPERLLRARCRTGAEVLWAMEDGLRCPALAAVAGDVGALDFAVTRRLQLAAGDSGRPLLLHRPWHDRLTPSAALTRWRVAAAPAAPETGHPRWRLDLVRCRGGKPGEWTVTCDPARGLLETQPSADDLLVDNLPVNHDMPGRMTG